MVLKDKYTVLDCIIETMVHLQMFTLSNILFKLMVFKYICAHYPIKVMIKCCLSLLEEYMMGSFHSFLVF